jgi:beta-galactosidase/beta-glucuronidase
MKKHLKIILIILFIISVSCTLKKEPVLKIAENPILTPWSQKVNPQSPWPEYPRPDLVREKWLSLNGPWEYTITQTKDKPLKWDGEILVPYPVQSALSGVKKVINGDDNLWYRRKFRIPSDWKRQAILLNFEASDWETTVWIDEKEAGSHKGGYDPFTFDISGLLGRRKDHEIVVRVWDPTDKGTQPRGKQVSNPKGIWYTPTTGIWQSVWLEPVNNERITSFRFISGMNDSTIKIIPELIASEGCELTCTLTDKGEDVSSVTVSFRNDTLTMKLKDPILWTPDNPHLYDVVMILKKGDQVLDKVQSYTGIRRISIGKTDDGFTKILLNNKFTFQLGPLDQGFWPDGIYTPPTAEAMQSDLDMIKKMGFNMLRKHVKVENRIFYSMCDRLGLLVWQDMPSCSGFIDGDKPDLTPSDESAAQYKTELKRMIETKYNHPSIIMWVAFNEGWGQFDTPGITKLISKFDPTRLVNSASGWSDRGTGNVLDIHHYPEPVVPPAEESRAIVLGEYGGLGLPLTGHTWEKENWGYRNMEDSLQLLSRYNEFISLIRNFEKEKGLSAAVYTQTTDVETETNGLLTYDRKVNKMGAEKVFKANMVAY